MKPPATAPIDSACPTQVSEPEGDPPLPARGCTPADLAALVALEERCFSGDRMSRRQWRHALTRGNAAVVAVDGPTPGGLLGAYVLLFRAGTSVARLYSIAVAPEGRGRGLGRTLLVHATERARERGARVFRAETRDDNVAMQSVFRRLGWTHFGRHPAYYEDGMDAQRWERLLPGAEAAAC